MHIVLNYILLIIAIDIHCSVVSTLISDRDRQASHKTVLIIEVSLSQSVRVSSYQPYCGRASADILTALVQSVVNSSATVKS